jgi:hypothetical protein
MIFNGTFIAGTVFFMTMLFLQPFAGAYVSWTYFHASPRSQSIFIRLIVSAHGALLAATHLLAAVLVVLGATIPSMFQFLVSIVCISIGSIFISFVLYRGSKSKHLLQIINFLGLPGTYFLVGATVERTPF